MIQLPLRINTSHCARLWMHAFLKPCAVSALFLLVALSATPAYSGQPDANGDGLQTQVYDVRDLLLFPGPAGLDAPDSTDEQRETARQQKIQTLVALVTESTGEPVDGKQAQERIVELNGNLIVKAAPEEHEQIAETLEAHRMVHTTQIVHETHLMLLDTPAFERIFGKELDTLTWDVSGDMLADPSDNAAWSGVVAQTKLSDDQAQRVFKVLRESDGLSLLMDAPKVTTFNKQRASAVIANQTAYVNGVQDKEGVLEPDVGVVTTGLRFAFDSTVDTDANSIGLRVDLDVSTFAGPLLALPVKDNDGMSIQVPHLDRATMRADVEVPDGAYILLVGPLVQGILCTGEDDIAELTDTRRVVVLIKPTVILPQAAAEPVVPNE